MGPLAGRVRGAGTLVDYINLLTSLIFLRTCAPEQWHNLSRSTPPAKSPKEAERLLARIGEAADTALRRTGISPGMKSSLSRLQPEYEDLAHIIRLSEGLDRSAIRPLLEQYEEHAEPKSRDFFTPRGVTQLMATLLTIGNDSGDAAAHTVVYDPYARGGELLTAAAAALAAVRGTASPTVRGSIPHPASRLLAGMNLALHGLPAVLDTGSATPWEIQDQRHEADFIVANPPFNNSGRAPRRRKNEDWPFGSPPLGNDNLAWVQHILERLRPHGRAAIVMPNNAAASTNQQERAIRQRLVDQGAVECVIALPPHLFVTTPIPVFAVALSAALLKTKEGAGTTTVISSAAIAFAGSMALCVPILTAVELL